MVVVGIAVVLATSLAYVVWPRGSTAFTEQEAIADFHARSGDVAAIDDSRDQRVLPTDGVYIFSATGGEEIKLGPFPAQSRPYPESVPVVVVRSGPGCFTVTLNLLDQHTEDTKYCAEDPESLRLESHTKHQMVGALSPTAEMTCNPDRLVGPEGDAQDLDCRLVLSGGPVDLSAEIAGTAQVAPPVTTRVDGISIDTVRLDLSYEVSGDLDGTWEESLWLRQADLLPLRIERDLDLAGLADFEEHSTLALSELDPAT